MKNRRKGVSRRVSVCTGKIEDPSESNPDHVEKFKGAEPATAIVGCGTKASQPTACFLDKLPPEVRVMIYEELLTKREDVEIEREWLATYRTAGKYDRKFRTSDLHATILRTCRTIHQEGLPILYGGNRFYFADADDLIAFAYSGLKRDSLGDVLFGLQYEPHGRLALLRNVYLGVCKFGHELFSPWREIIYHINDEDRVLPIGFPKLQRLTLDFLHWRGGGKEINVRFPTNDQNLLWVLIHG